MNGEWKKAAECFIEILLIVVGIKDDNIRFGEEYFRGVFDSAWLRLGVELWDTVHDGCDSDIECLIDALHVNPEDVGAWCNLGWKGGGTVRGECKTSTDCFARAQFIDSRHAVRCVVETYKLDPNYVDAWLGLVCVWGRHR